MAHEHGTEAAGKDTKIDAVPYVSDTESAGESEVAPVDGDLGWEGIEIEESYVLVAVIGVGDPYGGEPAAHLRSGMGGLVDGDKLVVAESGLGEAVELREV